MSTEEGDITGLLQRWQQGEKDAESAVMSAIYPLLRRLAASRLRRSGTMTWQPTELIHEAYEKLILKQRVDFQNRSHFMAIAAHVMRRVVADHYRLRHAQKRGGEASTVSLDDVLSEQTPNTSIRVDLMDIDRLLNELAAIDARAAEIVELRYFAGMSVEEASDVLQLSERTVKRSWQFARAWLHGQLTESETT
ncbi:MAG: ECF-type sigma factor [Dokdonella sp.]